MVKNHSTDELIAFGYLMNLQMRNQTYFSGGSGYVMSKAAITKFVEEGVIAKNCYKQRDGSEDINVGE